jgi:hypothetical protein
MAQPSISAAEFAQRMLRAGLKPDAEALAEMYQAYAHIERMAERVRSPRGVEAEPATIFVPVTSVE